MAAVLGLVAATLLVGWLRPIAARLIPDVFAWHRAWRIILLAHLPSVLLALAVVALTARLGRRSWRASAHQLVGPAGAAPDRDTVAVILLLLGVSVAAAVAGTGLRLGLSPDAPFLFSQYLLDIGVREEIVFRGFVYWQFRRRMSFTAAAAASGLLFWAVHLPKYAEEWIPGTPWYFVVLKYGFPFVFSFAAAALLERCRSLWPCVVFHLAIDYGYLLRVNAVGEPGPWPTALVLALGQWAAVVAVFVLNRRRP